MMLFAGWMPPRRTIALVLVQPGAALNFAYVERRRAALFSGCANVQIGLSSTSRGTDPIESIQGSIQGDRPLSGCCRGWGVSFSSVRQM